MKKKQNILTLVDECGVMACIQLDNMLYACRSDDVDGGIDIRFKDGVKISLGLSMKEFVEALSYV